MTIHLPHIGHRLAQWLIACVCLGVAVAAQSDRAPARTTVEFPDFPVGAVMIDLGQSVTIEAETKNDGGTGVTWTCVGEACTAMTTTPHWATFHASGITGKAVITATSIQQPSANATVTVTVNLNFVQDMKCD
jgi:hypothetical protein